MSAIDKLLQGSIDMHVHHSPDPRVERRLDALEVALQAQTFGMRAVVLKSHEYPTAPVAYVVGKQAQNIAVFGSICLDLEVGGLNPYALEASAKMGAKVVWMPTFTSANDMRIKGISGQGISILDEKGNLLPVIDDILDITKNYRMVLSTGHLSLPESVALVERAVQRGVAKIVITHPLSEVAGAYFGLPEQRQMAEKGAFLEHCFSHTMYFMGRIDPMTFVEAIRTVGAEHCIMTTDLGQAFNPAPAEGMRMLVGTMLQCGLTEKELELMIKVNPAKLLDLN